MAAISEKEGEPGLSQDFVKHTHTHNQQPQKLTVDAG